MEAVSAETMLPANKANKTPKRKTKSKKQPLGESCNDYCSRVAEAYNKNMLTMLTVGHQLPVRLSCALL